MSKHNLWKQWFLTLLVFVVFTGIYLFLGESVFWASLCSSILIVFFIIKYREDRLTTLWITVIILVIILAVLLAGFAYSDSMNPLGMGEWRKVDNRTCEKEIKFIGLDNENCRIALNKELMNNAGWAVESPDDKNNDSVGLIMNPRILPQCYKEVCK